ncbi:MAG: LysR family transcriptional regulator [Raoultibacter sp.]
METEHLREYLALSESMNYMQAAKSCFTTEQTLRAHIRGLEELLGCKLIGKRGSALSLTAPGQVLLLKAREIVPLADQVATDCKRAAETLIPLMACSLGHLVFENLLTEAGMRLESELENAKMDVQLCMGMNANLESILSGKSDVSVFLYQCSRNDSTIQEPVFPDEIAGHFIFEEPLYFWMNHHNLLFKQKTLCAQDFEGFRLVLGNTQNMQREGSLIKAIFSSLDVNITIENRPYQNYSEIFLSSDDKAFGAFSKNAHYDFFIRNDVRPFELPGINLYNRTYVIRRKECPDTRQALFFKMLDEVIDEGVVSPLS